MKKLFKALGIIIIVILVLLFTLPIVFKGKIIDIANEQINNNINAKAEFTDLRLSFFKNFPNLSIGLKGLTVEGIDKFEGDTLVAFKSFNVAVDVMSIINGNSISVKVIELVEPKILGKILTDGSANWDIAKASEEETVEEKPDTSASETPDINIKLKRFAIVDANIVYDDAPGNMSAALKNFNFLLSGDFSKDYSDLDVNITADDLFFKMSGIPYLNHANLNINLIVGADLANNKYILKDNTFSINDLALGWDGSVELLENSNMNINMNFFTRETSFKTLLSLVPAVYMNDFSEVMTDGSLKLDGNIKGMLTENTTPNAIINLAVNNAMFKYPDLPKSVNNIGIDLHIDYDGVNNDNTVIDLNKFHMELEKSPVDIVLNIKTPMSDPSVNGKFISQIDLAQFLDVIPLEDVSLKGVINSNLDFLGSLSQIENENYEQFKADGSLSIQNFEYNSPDLPGKFYINQALFEFSPKYVNVEYLDAGLGKSDFQFSGKVENFIPYALSDDILKGSFSFSSHYLDLNEFMAESGEEPVTEETDTATTEMAVVEVPANLDLKLYSKLDEIIYDKLDITNAQGLIVIKDSRVILDELKMNLLDGEMTLNGEYNSKDPKSPMVDFAMDIKNFDIPKTANSLPMIEKLAPIAKQANGKFSMDLGYTSFLNEGMKPILNSLAGKGGLSSNNISISGTPTLNGIANTLKQDDLKSIVANDVLIDFAIRAGRIFVEPFDVKIGDNKLNISGDQGIDQTLNYLIKMTIPKSGVTQSLSNSISSLAASQGIDYASSNTINVNMAVGGTFSNPTIKPMFMQGEGEKSVKENITSSVRSEATKQVEEKKEEIKKKASEQADKILAEAKKKADMVRAEGKRSADAVRKQSDTQANNLVKQASNPIAKKAAEVTAQKIRQEGEAKAKKIESEANSKANAIIKKAEQEADKLR